MSLLVCHLHQVGLHVGRVGSWLMRSWSAVYQYQERHVLQLLLKAVQILQELLALPAITAAILHKFEADVAATGSEKEQRFIIRKLLMQSGMFPA